MMNRKIDEKTELKIQEALIEAEIKKSEKESENFLSELKRLSPKYYNRFMIAYQMKFSKLLKELKEHDGHGESKCRKG